MEKYFVVAALVFLTTLTSGKAQSCDLGNLTEICTCDIVQYTGFNVSCNCNSNQTMTIDTLKGQHFLLDLQIQGCEDVVIKTGSLEDLGKIQQITFSNITSLTLETESVLVNAGQEKFNLKFINIGELSLLQNAIVINGIEPFEQSIEIVSSSIQLLEANAINVTQKYTDSRAVVTGTKMTLDSLRSAKGQLRPKWLTGYVSELSITNSNLTLPHDAFSRVTLQETSETKFTLRNNHFGEPSLPSKAFDMVIENDDTVTVDASDNVLSCGCEDLLWLREGPRTDLKREVEASMKCKEPEPGENVAALVEKCGSGGNMPQNMMMINLFALTVLLISSLFVSA